MNDALKELLFNIRQHAGYQDLLKAVETPRLPRFRRSETISLEEFGAKAAFESGRLSQHENWIALLTGSKATDGENS